MRLAFGCFFFSFFGVGAKGGATGTIVFTDLSRHDAIPLRLPSLRALFFLCIAVDGHDCSCNSLDCFLSFFFFCIVVVDYHIRIYVAVEKKLCNTDMQAVQHVGGGWITLGVKMDIYNGTLQPVDGRGYTQIDT